LLFFDRQFERCKTGRAVSDQRLATQKSDTKKACELARKQKKTMTIKLKTRMWDAAENLETGEDMAAYLEAALENGDPALSGAALADTMRAKGVTQIARDTGLSPRASTMRCCRMAP
jgi:probable addiction module antidote protein